MHAGGAGPQQREALHEEPAWGHLNRVRRIGRELRLRLVRLPEVALTEWYERMCRWLKTAAGSGRRARTQPLPVDTCMLDDLKSRLQLSTLRRDTPGGKWEGRDRGGTEENIPVAVVV